MPDIPVEILLKVIEDHLYDDRPTLLVLSLVCKDAVFTSQRCLFRRLSIRLAADGLPEPSTALQRMLARPERLISSIKDFSLRIAFATTEQCLHWFEMNRDLLGQALDRLLHESSITNLSIVKGSGGDVFATEWSQRMFGSWLDSTGDGSRMFEYIRRFCSLPSLQSLELERLPTKCLNQSFPTTLLEIKAKRLEMLPPSAFALSSDLSPNSAIHIERLALSSIDAYPHEQLVGPAEYFLSSSNKYVDIGSLKHLAWETVLSEDRNAIIGILERCHSSLQRLTLKSSCECPHFLDSCGAKLCPSHRVRVGQPRRKPVAFRALQTSKPT